MDVKAGGLRVDKKYPDIIYVPEDAHFDLHKQKFPGPTARRTRHQAAARKKPMSALRLQGPHGKAAGANRAWRLVGTVAEGTLCHKPCTVSGGGKSEISKPITDAILTGPVFVADFKRDFDRVAELIAAITRTVSDDPRGWTSADPRPERSLGSVIKLLTPDEHDYTPEYNAWLETVPQYLKELVFVVKRYYKPEWGDNWRDISAWTSSTARPATN
jgi:phosphoenolpyruvate carboxykinase (diphosphate)